MILPAAAAHQFVVTSVAEGAGAESWSRWGGSSRRRHNGLMQLSHDLASRLKFNGDGLLPAITQDAVTGAVLMLAWMDAEALIRTLTTGRATYWSRSRQEYWVKGETSGHVQQVASVHLDCDGDTILLKVAQTGAACHTGSPSCFFTELTSADLVPEEVAR